MGRNESDTAEWPEEHERFFLDILADRVKQEINGVPMFKNADWVAMDAQMEAKFDSSYGAKKRRSKYHRLKMTHNKIAELLDRTRHAYDSNTGIISANPDVWEEFIKCDKAFKKFKRTGCKIYPLMSIVFSGSTATGAFGNASTCGPLSSDEERRIEDYVGSGEGGSRGKRKSEGEIESLPGMRRQKKGDSSNAHLISIFREYSESMKVKTETEKLKADIYNARLAKYGSKGEGSSIVINAQFKNV